MSGLGKGVMNRVLEMLSSGRPLMETWSHEDYGFPCAHFLLSESNICDTTALSNLPAQAWELYGQLGCCKSIGGSKQRLIG